jgi:hypothetical protein
MTLTSGGAITGGTFVSASGTNVVTTSGAASATVVGVAAHDVAGSGQKVTVWPLRNVTHEIASTGTIAAGDGIQTGAAGVAATAVVATAAAAGTLVGIAETPATGGALVRFIGR